MTYGFATVRLNTNGSLDTSFGTGGTVVTQVLYSDPYSNGVALETINGQTMIVDAGTAENASDNQCFAVVRYTPSGSLDSGASDATTASFRPSASPAATVSTGIIPDGLVANPSPSSPAIGAMGSATSTHTTILDSGLVLQALESADFLDTLPSGRRRG